MFENRKAEAAKKQTTESFNVQDFYTMDVGALYYHGFIEEEDSDSNIMFINEPDKTGEETIQIKCGALSKLIERVTFHTNYGILPFFFFFCFLFC